MSAHSEGSAYSSPVLLPNGHALSRDAVQRWVSTLQGLNARSPASAYESAVVRMREDLRLEGLSSAESNAIIQRIVRGQMTRRNGRTVFP